MNILYTLNDKFVPQVAAGICSVCENNKEQSNICFFIISSGVSKYNKTELTNLVNKYNRKIEIIELGDVNQHFDFEFDTTGWNSIVIARLLIARFIPKEIEKILYLDGDTIVKRDLTDLYNIDSEDKILGMSIEPTVDKKRLEILEIEDYPYYNSGVILIDLKKWREMNAEKIIMDYCKKMEGKLFAPDQDAINGALKDYIYTISPKYNFYNIFYQYPYKFLCKLMLPKEYIKEDVFKDAIENPCIIHYLGEERPWRKGNHHRYKNDYDKYLSLTYWKGENYENGWNVYFVFWYTFNFLTKPFPSIRYKIINSLIPTFMKIRTKKIKKEKSDS